MNWRARLVEEMMPILMHHFYPESGLEEIAREIAEALPSPDERNGYAIVPINPTEEMITAGMVPTAAWQNIQGSALTVNREKMRLRYQAMVKSVL
jgi:hypothetical protein